MTNSYDNKKNIPSIELIRKKINKFLSVHKIESVIIRVNTLKNRSITYRKNCIYISLPDDKNLDEINAYSVKECVDSLGITKNTINVKITSSQNEIKLFAITPNKKRHNRGVKYAFPSAKAFPQTSSGKGGKPKSHSRKTSYSSISELISFEPGHGTGRNKK